VAGVYLAERLNSILGENWKSFSSQNYFDPSGVFMSVLWSGPLLAFAMIILVGISPYVTTIMVTVIFSY
jgi:transmembrane protein 18